MIIEEPSRFFFSLSFFLFFFISVSLLTYYLRKKTRGKESFFELITNADNTWLKIDLPWMLLDFFFSFPHILFTLPIFRQFSLPYSCTSHTITHTHAHTYIFLPIFPLLSLAMEISVCDKVKYKKKRPSDLLLSFPLFISQFRGWEKRRNGEKKMRRKCGV